MSQIFQSLATKTTLETMDIIKGAVPLAPLVHKTANIFRELQKELDEGTMPCKEAVAQIS